MAKRLCNCVRISTAITYTAPNLIVNLPAGSYNDDEVYCVITAQNIPSTATVNAPVVCTIGTGTQQYPMVNCDCSQTTASQLHSRTKYPVKVETNATSAVFRRMDRSCGCCENNLMSVNGTAPVTATSVGSDS